MSMRAEQHVFLSYPRRNEKEAAELRRVIEADGHVVWQDRSAIQGGDDWVKAIVAGLERAYAVVAVVSAAWSTSKWIRTEVLQAQRMNKTVIPVLVDDSEIPTELLTLHVISIYADQAAAGMESLLATLHAMRGRAGSSFVAPTAPRLTEIGYLDEVIHQYEDWSELYTPLAGLGQLPADSGPDLPGKLHWIDTGFIGDFAGGDAGGTAGTAGTADPLGAGQRGGDAGHVGVVTVPGTVGEDHRIGRAYLGHQCLGPVQQRQHGALQRHGQRQPGPVRAAPGQQAGQPGRVALDRQVTPAGQAERPVGGQVQHRGQRVRDRRAEHGRAPGRIRFQGARPRTGAARSAARRTRPSCR
jgi:hypothetical protein